MPPTIRSATENPHLPGGGKSLARKAGPESPVVCIVGDGMFGVWVTGGQQTCATTTTTTVAITAKVVADKKMKILT